MDASDGRRGFGSVTIVRREGWADSLRLRGREVRLRHLRNSREVKVNLSAVEQYWVVQLGWSLCNGTSTR